VIFPCYLKSELQGLLEVQPKHFDGVFARVEHQCQCTGVASASLCLHFVRHDATGEQNSAGVIKVLLGYITQYCLSSEKRKDLDEFDRNLNNLKARELFRNSPNSGQAGEFLAYLFIESVLKAPQVLKKMPLTTNTEDERKGSDGVHIRMTDDGLMELIFAEAKLVANFSGALSKAFTSMKTFHTSGAKLLEKTYFTSSFGELPTAIQADVVSFFEGVNFDKSREVYACFIGFDWDEYKCLLDDRRALFVKEFEERYKAWAAATIVPALENKIGEFPHKHIRFEFFFLPFRDVAAFRQAFLDAL
jgi:Cap4 SAVED domain